MTLHLTCRHSISCYLVEHHQQRVAERLEDHARVRAVRPDVVEVCEEPAAVQCDVMKFTEM
jgi:hypothetical protein